MIINSHLLVELTELVSKQNENPVSVEKPLVQKNTTKNRTGSYNVQLGNTDLILSKSNNYQWSEAQLQEFSDQLDQIERQKKLYYQIYGTVEPLASSKSAIVVRGGDLGKSGPGARAKGAAMRNRKKGSIVVDAYYPIISQMSRPHDTPKSRLEPLFGRSNTPSTQLSREERRELNRQRTQPKIFDTNITIVSQDFQLTTPDDLSQEVIISDARPTGQSQRIVQLLKKTLSKKYPKHRKEFKNPDNSPITSKDQFFDAHVRHFQDSKVVRIRGIYLSKDHDPFDCSFYLNPETNQLISAKELDHYDDYVGPRKLTVKERNRFWKHGVVGEDRARFKDISWIKHGMTAEDIMRHYNFSKKGKLNDEVMDSVEVAKQFSEIMKNQCFPSDDL